MTATTTEYATQLERAQRHFALCVIQIQNDLPPFQPGWRKKADQLQWAINEARGCIECGAIGTACMLLRRENEPK